MFSPVETENTGRNHTINIRVKESQRNLIDKAASVSGKTRSDFMLEVACKEAENVLLNRTFFNLDDEKYQEFMAILDAPAKADKELRDFLTAKSPWE
jgi:uncharacterized protein (DUF1778 family)